MKGFTLIEVLVSVAIFSVVMVIALGALLAISVSNRKAESIKSVLNNLNFAVDSMSRAVRTGTSWGSGTTPGLDGGSNTIVFTSTAGVATYYRLDSAQDSNSKCGQTVLPYGCIERSLNGTSNWLPITSPEVVITDNSPGSYVFYVIGSAAGPGNTIQPKLFINLSGYVKVTGGASSQAQCGTTGNQCSVFHLQTSVAQRIYDQ